MSIMVLAGFDGSCPHSNDGVTCTDPETFILKADLRTEPGLSEEAPGCGAHFYTRLVNDSESNHSATIIVDWGGDGRDADRDVGHVRHEGAEEWTLVDAEVQDGCATYRLDLAPGMTELAMWPAYNTSMCQSYMDDLVARGVAVASVGASLEGRPVWEIDLPSSDGNAPVFFIQARDHAYETAGSFCVEGLVEYLLSDDALAGRIRSQFHIIIHPMTNPDGVHNGMSRLTSARGADMNRLHTVDDPAHTAHKAAIDKWRPLVHMNIHNWMSKVNDGLLANDESMQNRILKHLPADTAHGKEYYLQTKGEYLIAAGVETCPLEAMSWKDYVQDNFNGLGVTFEFPWYGRSCADMRELGRKAFIAMALSAMDELKEKNVPS
jgi:Zinc carboxypeptidase